MDHPSPTTVKLQGSYFELQWRGVPLCRNAFQLLYGVSRRKLIVASKGLFRQVHGNSLVDHENSLTHDIIAFLDDLKRRCGSQCDHNPSITYLNGFYEKKQVWKHYVDTRADNSDVASDSHFYAVWTRHHSNIVTESDAMKCATCTKIDIQLSSPLM